MNLFRVKFIRSFIFSLVVMAIGSVISDGLADWETGFSLEPEGEDIITMPSGSLYRGELVNGQRTNYGESWDITGHYSGNWANDVKEGYGVLKVMTIHKKKYMYEGEFSNDMAHGTGRMTFWNKICIKSENGYPDHFTYGLVTNEGVFVNGRLTEKTKSMTSLYTKEWWYNSSGEKFLRSTWHEEGWNYVVPSLNDEPHGTALKTFVDGTIKFGLFEKREIVGPWRNNMM